MESLIHIISWGIVFAFPLAMFSHNYQAVTWSAYLRHGGIVPFAFFVVFYVNYLLLIPRYLFAGRTKEYIAFNVLLILCLAVGLHFWQNVVFPPLDAEKAMDRRPPTGGPPRWGFFLRDIFAMILIVGVSLGIRLTRRWTQIETVRREAEKSRTEAELKNLRSQLNPHFLLNTLNNIYALIAFDADKAQAAVQELSRLLRHVLYDNQQDFVPMGKEMDFIRSYIELMRIRLTDNVEVDTRFDVNPDSRTGIAPLIFISLIENAFKHGISPTEPSYIHIYFQETAREIRCAIRNSYHPKSEADKSGSGIGLEQVSKRLELIYPGRYTWTHGVDASGKEYCSELVIKL